MVIRSWRSISTSLAPETTKVGLMNPIKRVLSYPGASAALKAERAKMAALHEEALAADRYRDLARSRVYTTADYEADKWRARQGPDGARGPDGVTGVTGATGPNAPMRVIDYHLKPDPLPLSEEVPEAGRASV